MKNLSRVAAFALMLSALGLGGCPMPTGTLALAPVAQGLSNPLFLTMPPGDTARLFIVEQGGTIEIVKNGQRLAQPFLDVSARIADSGGERGLLGLAFHPDYANNGQFFVNYTNEQNNTRIERYTVSGSDPDRADPETAQTILEVDQPFANHNGGMLAFGPDDGYLYIAMGDGGSGNDPNNNGQSLETLLGKILRLDVDGGTPYAVPADNPFVGDDDLRGEIWAYGLRNPWRFSFDRETADLYIGDVGQNAREEINFQPAASSGGENYGWRNREGSICRPGEEDCELPGAIDPIHDYEKPFSQSVTGGYVYRGAAIPALQGTYLFADFVTGEVWSLRYDGTTVSEFILQSGLSPSGGGNIASFGEDANGELYVVDYGGGSVYRIVPADS